MMKKGLYNCGEPGCSGHQSFIANCLTDVRQVADYPVLTMFQNGWELEDPTEPFSPIADEPGQEQQTGGGATRK